MSVRYRIFDTDWGPAGLAWSEAGVCQVVLPGMGRGRIEKEIVSFYRGAKAGRGQEAGGVIGQIREYFSGRPIGFRAGLDLSWASPFQASVYEVLMQIPYGETWSYAEVAARAGKPGAARAVGGANSRNRIPLIIPCHRVVSADGSYGGFSGPGGVKAKIALLEMERAALRDAVK